MFIFLSPGIEPEAIGWAIGKEIKKRHLVGKLRTKPRFACKENLIHTGKLDTDLTKMNNPREGMDEPLIANSNAMGWPKK